MLFFTAILFTTTSLHANPQVDPSAELNNTLSTLLEEKQHGTVVTHFLEESLDQIVREEHLVIKAIILARNHQLYHLALKIADKALIEGLRSERLFYEIGLVYLLQGSCLNAGIIFNALIRNKPVAEKDDANAWMVAESRAALKLCQSRNIWIYDYDIALGYSNNLAGVTPEQNIKPEQGSVLGQFLDALRVIFPGTPKEISVGIKPKAGFTATTNMYLDQHHYVDGTYYGIHLIGGLTATQPEGYETTRLSLGMSRRRVFEDIVLSNYLSAYFHKHEQGPNSGQVYTEGVRLFNAVSYRSAIIPTLAVTVGAHRSKMSTRFTNKTTQIAFKMRNKSALSLLPWVFEIGQISNDYASSKRSSKSKYINLGLERYSVNPNLALSVNIKKTDNRPLLPQPWRKNRHKSTAYKVSVITHSIMFDRSVDVMMEWQNAYINNQNADYDLFTLSFRANRVWH